MKTFLLIILSFFIIRKNMAQEQRFRPGIIAGLVATDLVGMDPYNEDFHKAGFTGGGLLNMKISSKSSFQFEILYTQKGSFQPADSSNNYVYTKLSIDYVEVPLMFKYKIKFNINKKPVDRFYLELGPSIGRYVRINETNSYGAFFDYSQFKKTEFALNLGAGCTIIKNLAFNFRFSNSILPVVKRKTLTNNFLWRDTFNKGDNMVFAFTFRYLFGKEGEGNDARRHNDGGSPE